MKQTKRKEDDKESSMTIASPTLMYCGYKTRFLMNEKERCILGKETCMYMHVTENKNMHIMHYSMF